ncbi:kinase-like protein [Ramicandelaber brevisporus]|nr:kinase-like protein [Ramicandelaber brevisporus]
MSFLVNTLASVYTAAFDLIQPCLPSPSLVINGRSYEIVRSLGEGAFASVLLVRDTATSREFALKKMIVPSGMTLAANAAQNEVTWTRRLNGNKNIIELKDCAIETSTKSITTTIGSDGNSGGDKVYLMLLPVYRGGSLMNMIYRNMVENTHMPESRVLELFSGICEGVLAMHTYTAKTPEETAQATRMHQVIAENCPEYAQSHPATDENGQLLFPCAHRDIKPGNVLLSDDGVPVLMDLGSADVARQWVGDRSQALTLQDDAAQLCSMPYRAPELFDVKPEAVIDEAVDIWSLGCLLYALAFNDSPFERQQNQQGGNIALAVLGAKYTVPSSARQHYSQELIDLIKFILNPDPAARPNIRQVLAQVQQLRSASTAARE